MSETPEKELKNIESMMFGGFIEPTPKNGIAWRVFEAVMGLRKERNQWRECAVRLAGSIALAPVIPTNSMKSALAEFERLQEESK
jgi:hypothetical protein